MAIRLSLVALTAGLLTAIFVGCASAPTTQQRGACSAKKVVLAVSGGTAADRRFAYLLTQELAAVGFTVVSSREETDIVVTPDVQMSTGVGGGGSTATGTVDPVYSYEESTVLVTVTGRDGSMLWQADFAPHPFSLSERFARHIQGSTIQKRAKEVAEGLVKACANGWRSGGPG